MSHDHPSIEAADTQCAAILQALQSAQGQWVSMLHLHRVSQSFNVHSRIADLRKRGHQIENKTDRRGRTVLSSYRLITHDIQPTLI